MGWTTPITVALLVGLPAFAAPTVPLAALADGSRNGQAVRVQAVVTYCDVPTRCLFIQDGDRGAFVSIPDTTPPVRPGQTVEVDATVRNRDFLDATAVRLVDPAERVPPAIDLGDRPAGLGDRNRRLALRGVVRTVAVEGEHTILAVVANRARVRVFVANRGPEPSVLNRLVDAEVEAVGVCGLEPAVAGRERTTKLLVHQISDVHIVRAAPPRPFEALPTPIAAVPAASDHRLRVRGHAAGPPVNGLLTLTDGPAALRVAVPPDLAVRAGELLEAVGFATRRDGQPLLEDAVVRMYAPRAGADQPAGPADLLPIQTAVAEIRRLAAAEAGRGYPVRIAATVTFHHAGTGWLFVHDGIEGIFVTPPEAHPQIPDGTVVRIDGYTASGDFAPTIVADRIVPLRSGPLPTARQMYATDLHGGRADAQWVKFTGVVRGTGVGDHGDSVVHLRVGTERATAIFPGPVPRAFASLRGATVRVRAVCGSNFDEHRRWAGLTFYVPSMEQVAVLRSPPDVDMRPVAIDNLDRFDPDRSPGELVSVAGTAIAHVGTGIVLQDGNRGMLVDLANGERVALGGPVAAHGFLVRRNGAWGLEDAMLRPGPAGPPVAPLERSPGEIVADASTHVLVRTHGILVDRYVLPSGEVALLLKSAEPADNGRIFSTLLPTGDEAVDRLAPGSDLELTGAVVRVADTTIAAFRLYLRGPEDIVVLHEPPWWSPRKIQVAMLGIVALFVGVLAWVATLRRQLRRQTALIRNQLVHEAQLEDRYRDVVESASDVILSLDGNGRVATINPAGRELTGLAPGTSFLEAVTPRSRADGHDLAACQGPITREVGLAVDGGVILLEVNARPLYQDGHWVGTQAIARDLTQRRRLETDLRHAQKMEAIGRLAGGVAHDFNNLLTVINGNASMLTDRVSEADADLLTEVVRAGDQAAALTRQLLAFSRKGIIAPKTLCPNDVVTGMRGILVRLAGHRIELKTDLDPELGCIKIDPGQLEQAVLNLTVNARDAMPEGGTLTIRTTSWIGHARLEISDTGVGMDDATRTKIFEPFFTTKLAGEGTGLGLATVHSIVEQANGRIQVRSAPGRGTTFAIDFPFSDDSLAPGEPSTPLPLTTAAKELILLVEDEPAVQLLERRVLEMGNYEVLTASSGAEALDVLSSCGRPIDVLVTDVVMPGMGGRELAETATRHQSGLRVLFTSGYTPDEVLRQGVRAEEVHFLQKPFAPSALLEKLREILVPAGR